MREHLSVPVTFSVQYFSTSLTPDLWPVMPFVLQTVAYLFSQKILASHKFFLLRGNHELRAVQRMFQFHTYGSSSQCCRLLNIHCPFLSLGDNMGQWAISPAVTSGIVFVFQRMHQKVWWAIRGADLGGHQWLFWCHANCCNSGWQGISTGSSTHSLVEAVRNVMISYFIDMFGSLICWLLDKSCWRRPCLFLTVELELVLLWDSSEIGTSKNVFVSSADILRSWRNSVTISWEWRPHRSHQWYPRATNRPWGREPTGLGDHVEWSMWVRTTK